MGRLIIKMYSMGACVVLGMNNQEALSEDLESDPLRAERTSNLTF